MIPASLTARRAVLDDGSTAYPYAWRGKAVPVADAAGNVLRTVERLQEAEDAKRRFDIIVDSLLPDLDAAMEACGGDPREFGRMLEGILRDVCGVDLDGESADARIWDADEDAAAIRISLRMAYGVDWDEVRERVPWCEFLAMVFGLPYSTPLGKAMFYRNPKNRPEGGDASAEFDRLHALFALGEADGAEGANSAMTDTALGMLRKAGARG